MIFAGDLMPGSMHLEADLAEQLGMSRTPVREAALTLQAQGLLQVRPRKGVVIASISPRDMNEIYEILTELEGLSAFRAAEAGADTAGLNAAITAMDTALDANDREAWAKADEAFHAELVRLGDNARITTIVQTYTDQVRHARLVTLHLRPLPTRSNDDHRAVVAAIGRSDGDAARELHRAHRLTARRLLVELLDQYGLKHV
jgi:DNA-binding GntR family transcriptional regulator